LSEKDRGGGGGGGGGWEEWCQPEDEEDMRRRGRVREVGGAAGAGRGGRGRLARKGERARAEENLRERSIEKVPGREVAGRGGTADVGNGGFAGLGWKRRRGVSGFLRQPGVRIQQGGGPYLVNFKKFVCKGKCLCMQWKIKMEAKIHGSSSFSNIQNLYFKVL
jgi:hypothetical protein